MENPIISKINDNKKYIDGLKKIAENIELMTIEEYNQEYEDICSNNSLSEVSKTFYLSYKQSELILRNLLIPFARIAAYIVNNRKSEVLKDIFNTEYATNPILYSHLYELLIQLPQKEVDKILMYMCLSPNTFNRVYISLKHKSEIDFTAALEAEQKDLTKVLKQLNIYYFIYNLLRLSYEDNIDIMVDCINEPFEPFEPFVNHSDNEIIREFIRGTSEVFNVIDDLENALLDDNSNEIENILYERNYKPDIIMIITKRTFVALYYIISEMFKEVYLSDNELYYLQKFLYHSNNYYCNEFVELAKRYISIAELSDKGETKEICNNTEFVIPDDFFSNKMYITESKEDEWLFSIYLRLTDDNKKKVQALQTFINTIAENGFIKDNFHTKATFLYRMTGRKLPNSKPGVITWNDEMKNYNCFCYLVKNFEHDFLNQSKGNTRKGLYKKAQGFFGIIGNIENPSAKANDIQKTKFIIYYEQFKEDMK